MKNRNRILYVAEILKRYTDENHSLSVREISELLEKEYGEPGYRTTISEDIAALIESGWDIGVDRSTVFRYRLLSREFDRAELKLIIDAVNASRFITRAKSHELTGKISALAGPGSKGLNRCTEVENRIKNGNKKLFFIIDTIHEAIEKDCQIRFCYFRYNEKKQRVLLHGGKPYLFNPFFLVWNGEYYYMVGSYGNHPDKVASFRVDRIDACPEILAARRANPPESFCADQYLNSTIHMFGNAEQKPEEVHILCENSTANGIIDRFGPETEMRIVDDGHFKAVIHVIPTSVFYGWVFGFGGKVWIEGPEDVVRGFEEMVERVKKKKASNEASCAPCAAEQVDDVENSYLNS